MYAEWYDWYLRNPANASGPTWEHHLATYGPDISYEDFIANFTGADMVSSLTQYGSSPLQGCAAPIHQLVAGSSRL